MDIQQKLDSLAIFDIGWVTWLMAGFAVGGVAMLLERAICLLMDRFTNDGERWARAAGARASPASRGWAPRSLPSSFPPPPRADWKRPWRWRMLHHGSGRTRPTSARWRSCQSRGGSPAARLNSTHASPASKES